MELAYIWYEAAHMFMAPARVAFDATKLLYKNPANPLSRTTYGKSVAAMCEMFERSTRRYGKPQFGFDAVEINGTKHAIAERVIWERPFCRLVNFERLPPKGRHSQPKLLVVAPMSGHYATLLRGTIEAFLPSHDVYVTDWADARMVPLAEGRFDLDDYIDYLKSIIRVLGPDVHVMAVCQPAVPVMAAIARLEAENDPCIPRSMILMGGPIDTRRSPTAVNTLALKRGTEWFKRNCIVKVPLTHPGFCREVYPGFLQLSGFMAMNMDRHISAQKDMFKHLVDGDGDSAEKHREFYDEYLAVMDLTAEFYLQTVETVFVKQALPRGTMMHRDQPVDLKAIRRCGIMAVEGEKDDISGVGQTLAALDLTPHLPEERKLYHMQSNVGHYGVFNGSRYRKEIVPQITAFIDKMAHMVETPRIRKVVG